MARYRPPEGSTPGARRLRNDPIEAEKRMWRLLRECFPDVRFRRQVPIRDFVADFASHGLKPVVEAEGYRVLRFWNHDVLGNGDGVMTVLAPFCGDSTPTHEQVRIAPRSEAMSGGHGDLLISPIKGEGS